MGDGSDRADQFARMSVRVYFACRNVALPARLK